MSFPKLLCLFSGLISPLHVCDCKLSKHIKWYTLLSHTHALTHTLSLSSSSSDDHVIITEQTLDQLSFIVINQRSRDKGRVPVDYIRIGKEKEISVKKNLCVPAMPRIVDRHWLHQVCVVFLVNLPNSLQNLICYVTVGYQCVVEHIDVRNEPFYGRVVLMFCNML